MTSIRTARNFPPCRKSVRSACCRPNRNDHAPRGNTCKCLFSPLLAANRSNLSFRMHQQHYQRNDEVQLNEEELRQMAMRTHDTTPQPSVAVAAAAPPPTSTSPTAKATASVAKVDLKNDGTLSDSVLSNQPESNRKRRPSMSSKALVILGLSKKTNSTSNLGHGNVETARRKQKTVRKSF